MILPLLLASACFLAFSNGANDNFKGVASIYGSGTADYRTSITWGTLTTLAGSVASVFLAEVLLKKFSGKSLVPDAMTSDPSFLLAVAAGAGATVILATRLGFPVSTTHGLLGALIGAGWADGFDRVSLGALDKSFVVPLLLSPVLAVALGAVVYVAFHAARWRMGLAKQWCICVGVKEHLVPVPMGSNAFALSASPDPLMAFADYEVTRCTQRYSGSLIGVDAQRIIGIGLFASSGLVSFARGLNDTPKIAGVLLVVHWLAPTNAVMTAGAAMAAGGLLGARRVAETMSRKITTMNPGQGLAANLSTAALVLAASLNGLPVSTTHVAVGSLYGIGLTTGQANYRTMSAIVASWVLTLPCAALIAWVLYSVLRL